jgi:hypothetical protein
MLRWITLGVGVALSVISIINLLLFFKQKRQEEIFAAVESNEVHREILFDRDESS